MATIRNDILEEIRKTLLELEGVTNERVVIGEAPLARIGIGRPNCIIMIAIVSDKGTRSDGDSRVRVMELAVSVLIRTDSASQDSATLQLNEIYDPIHAKLEQLSDSAINGLAIMMEESNEGIMLETVGDHDPVSWIASVWEITYERDSATTGA